MGDLARCSAKAEGKTPSLDNRRKLPGQQEKGLFDDVAAPAPAMVWMGPESSLFAG